jgi:hypothetical protein
MLSMPLLVRRRVFFILALRDTPSPPLLIFSNLGYVIFAKYRFHWSYSQNIENKGLPTTEDAEVTEISKI